MGVHVRTVGYRMMYGRGNRHPLPVQRTQRRVAISYCISMVPRGFAFCRRDAYGGKTDVARKRHPLAVQL